MGLGLEVEAEPDDSPLVLVLRSAMVLTCAGRTSDLVGCATLVDGNIAEVLGFPLEASRSRCLSSLSCSICALPDRTGGSATGIEATAGGAFVDSSSSSDPDSGRDASATGGWSCNEAASALNVSDD